MSAIAFALLGFADWGADWWNTDLWVKVTIALALGAAVGAFDYWYTLDGNRRGRWDLIVDLNKGQVQIPAVGAYCNPCTVNMDHAVAVTIDDYASDDEDGTDQLNLHCYEEVASVTSEGTSSIPRHWKQPVAFGRDRTHQEALAEFLRNALGIGGESQGD